MKVHEVLARLDGVREGARGWTAKCPAHPDRSPSLSIGEGDDGRVLLTCFAGCSIQSIASAVGLTVADLFSEKPVFPPTRGMGRAEIASPGADGAADFSTTTPADLWARVRQGIRRERRRLLDMEEGIATSIFTLHQRARDVRQAVTALGRDDESGLDLLADAAAWERAALMAEAELDETRARIQMTTFRPRGK